MFGGNFAIHNYAMATGGLLAISSNNALFSLYGTTYGGDGRTTFGLPDLRGRSAVHFGTGPGLSPVTLGQMRGAEDHTLTLGQMPTHNHTVNTVSTTITGSIPATTAPGTSTAPAANGTLVPAGLPTIGSGPGATPINGYGTPDGSGHIPVEISSITGITATNNGASSWFYTLPPRTAITFLVTMFGIYPSRN